MFVDDGLTTAILLCWIAGGCLALRRLDIGLWSGPLLFAGIAAITFLSLKPRR